MLLAARIRRIQNCRECTAFSLQPRNDLVCNPEKIFSLLADYQVNLMISNETYFSRILVMPSFILYYNKRSSVDGELLVWFFFFYVLSLLKLLLATLSTDILFF